MHLTYGFQFLDGSLTYFVFNTNFGSHLFLGFHSIDGSLTESGLQLFHGSQISYVSNFSYGYNSGGGGAI